MARVHIEVLMDRSGSMGTIADDVNGGYAAFIRQQQEQARQSGDQVTVSLRTFDTRYETVYAMVPIDRVPAFELMPRGMTALYDAIGKTLNELDQRIARGDDTVPDKVVVVVITDGHENSSREFTSAEQIRKMISDRTTRGWLFVYLSADPDAFGTASGIGIDAGSVGHYTKSGVGTRSVFAAAAGSVTRYSRDEDGSLTNDERQAMAQDDPADSADEGPGPLQRGNDGDHGWVSGSCG